MPFIFPKAITMTARRREQAGGASRRSRWQQGQAIDDDTLSS